MEGLAPILLTLLLQQGTEEYPVCRDLSYYQQAQSGGEVYSASPETLATVWEKLKGGDVLLLGPGDYGNFIAGNGMATVSGSQSATSAETTTVIRPEAPKISIGTTTSTNWYGYAIPTGFTDWVTIAAADETNPPHFSSISIGTLYTHCPTETEQPDDSLVNEQCFDDDGDRKSIRGLLFSEDPENDIYLRFAGVVVEDGVTVKGARNFAITNSRIQLTGDPRSSMQRGGVTTFNAKGISINCNDITDAAFGVKIAAKDIEVTNNHIHHNSHDGISLTGGDGILIEGNTIHDLDDGIGDNDLVCIPGTARDGIYIDGDELVSGIYTIDEDDSSLTANTDTSTKDACPYLDQQGGCCTDSTWNMHTDGLHMYTVGWVNSKYAEDVTDVVIRSNLFYNYESMGIMINGNSVGVYQNFTIENNVFGPAGGNLIIFGAAFQERLIFRNNTILYAPDNTWTSIYDKQKSGQNYYVQTWNTAIDLPHYQYYNNILDANSIFGSSYTAGHNIYMGSSYQTPTDTDTMLDRDTAGLYVTTGTIQQQIDSGINPGEPLSGSIAIDFGTTSMQSIARERAQANLGSNRDGIVYEKLEEAVSAMNLTAQEIAENSADAAEIQARATSTTEEQEILDSIIAAAADIEAGRLQVIALSQQASSVATSSLSLARARAIIEVNQQLLDALTAATEASDAADELASTSPNKNDVITLSTEFATNTTTFRSDVTEVREYTYYIANNRTVLETDAPSLPTYDHLGNSRIVNEQPDSGAYEYVK